ncbi:MAG: CydC: thiol reductant exporter, CydC subunit [Pseudonocardia sp.]|nr:CydC: thiol reductant exporter, CydC subunit [Pseudonocardia sp.]
MSRGPRAQLGIRPLRRCLRLLAWRPAAVLAGGIALAVVAEASSVGLLGLSGWFIASCYLSGLNPLSTFSYLAPSGGVRSFALGRIGGRYAERLVTHAATLRWLTRLRAQMFLDAAAAGPGRLRRLRSGEALDRAMSDADTVDRALIRTVVPICVAVVGVLAGTAVISVVSTTAGETFLAASVLTTVVALSADGRRERHAAMAGSRGAARSEVIASVDAWEEMVSLGAVQQLQASSSAALDLMRNIEAGAARARSHARLFVDCCVGASLAAVLAVCALSEPQLSVPDTALILLLAAGVLELLAALPTAARSARDAMDAAARITALAPHTPVSAAGDACVSPASGGLPIQVRRLALAPRPSSGVGRLDLDIGAGQLLVVSGRSGSGKTTLLRVLAGELTPTMGSALIGGHPPHAYAPGEIVFVAHDDYLFTGSVRDNMRLADPAVSAERIEEILLATGLTHRGIDAATPVGMGGRPLSGGERRRLCLARAIVKHPRVLLLDEPTEGVDESTARFVLRRLRESLPAATIVAAIHDRDLDGVVPNFVARLSLDQVVMAGDEHDHLAAAASARRS